MAYVPPRIPYDDNANPPPRVRPSVQQSSTTLAVLSLVIGVFAIIGSRNILGLPLGVIGIVFGAVHLNREREAHGAAWSGIVVSAVGVIASIAVLSSIGGGGELSDWEGVSAPDFTVTTLDGKRVALHELRGKRVVVDIWATWCPPCRMEIPHFNKLAKELGDSVKIIGVSDEDESDLTSFKQSQEFAYDIATAHMPSPYRDVTGIPTTFFIDRNGVIDHVAVGYHDIGELRQYATAPDYAGAPKSAPNGEAAS